MQEHRVDLLVKLDRSDTAPEGLTRQLYAQVREAVVSGRLRAGERLPPTRDFAQRLGVARLTVATAYDWLRAEGYVYGRVGAGTFVASVFGDGASSGRESGDAVADASAVARTAMPVVAATAQAAEDAV